MTEDNLQRKTSASSEPGAPGKGRRLVGIRSRISIEELRNVYKRQVSQTQEDGDPVFDPMAKAQGSLGLVRGRTGLVYDRRMTCHSCLWDPQHVECPQRLTCVLDRCQELGLLEQCEILECRAATEEEVLQLHSPAHFSLLQTTSGEQDQEKLEDLASRFDSIFLHPNTYQDSLLAAGGTIELVNAVASGKVQNGFAIVRPPGHHAMESEFCGFCFINNVALAVRRTLDTHDLSRILIVDWDVHHGQATQQTFYSDPRVLYFSIHRYEHGSFWPNLRESNYDYTGEGGGKGYNFNLPLNRKGMANHDFLAIFHQVLMPVAYEFSPELVIVSAGFDAALGCTEGEMEVSPGMYAHLTSHLMVLARGKVAVVLEGGYYLPSLADSAAMTLSALLGYPCPPLMEPLLQPSPSLLESVLSLVYVQRQYWQCFQYQGSFTRQEVRGEADPQTFTPTFTFHGQTSPRPLRFPTREKNIPQPPEVIQRITDKLLKLQQKECVRPKVEQQLCLSYDEEMGHHRSLTEEHPERPERIHRVWELLKQAGVVDRAHLLQSRCAKREEVELVHTRQHVDFMFGLGTLKEGELQILQESYKSVYLHPKTNDCALLSSGCLLEVVEQVCSGSAGAGLALIRPPGHHAEPDHPHGFCFYNNVAVAASYAIHNLGLNKVLVVDWDVHHGNGIQHAFEDDPRVLYISLHRYDHGLFFPSSEDANYDHVGTGAGEGYNINIPWNKSGMGDGEYLAAFLQVVLPVAYQFDPQLVLVSAGFDAARGDPLGGCRVSPECFGHMTHLLSGLAGGKVVLALEGGYNLTSISFCMTLCAKALLGDPVPPLEPKMVPNKSAVQTINDVIRTHSKYWSSLCFQVDLPLEDVLCQGCGGGPQGVDSGLSGSETSPSSASSSPVSSPSITKSSPVSSPSTTTTSSPYVSAPSSPAKLNLEDSPQLRREDPMACHGGDMGEAVYSHRSVRVRTTRREQHKGDSNTSKCQSSEAASLSSPSSRSPRRTRKGSGRHEGVPARSERGTPKRYGKQAYVAGAMQAAVDCRAQVKGTTAIVCCQEHIDVEGQQNSIKAITEQCQELGLWQACTILHPHPATEAQILAVPSKKLLQYFNSSNSSNQHQEDQLLAAGCVVTLLQEIVRGHVQNGLALVQSTGHLVCSEKPSLDTSPSSVAIAVHAALDGLGVSRVLLVDWDGRLGSGAECIFSGNPQVLVMSVQLQHNLEQTSVEKVQGCSNILNVSIECDSFSSGNCLTMFHQVLLPVAYEFGPELVVMSALFKSTPHPHPALCSHLTRLLMPLAHGQLAMVVEVGQYLEATAEGVESALCSLMDTSPCPSITTTPKDPSLGGHQAVIRTMKVHQATWRSLRHHTLASIVDSYIGKPDSPPSPSNPTLGHCPTHLLRQESSRIKLNQGVCLVYNEAMMEHFNYSDNSHPERPKRISCIFERLREFGVVDRCTLLKGREATTQELERVHSPRHLRFMSSLQAIKPSELQQMEGSFESIYLHRRTNHAALLAAGSLITAVDCVMSDTCTRGLAVVRPPGHHAERNTPCGFCFYNSVAVAAQHAITTHRLQRVLIFDWDVHHGNGTQHIFESDPRVLYISIHRYDHAKFFPGSPDANYNRVGVKRGKGYNINIPWNKSGMGDGEYLAAFLQVVLPVAYQFDPQLVLVSAGFDAAVGDSLGGCNVTPECYGHMTKLLTCLGEGRIIVALEGGYNLTSISYSMTLCAKALLGDPLPCLATNLYPCQSALQTLTSVINTHSKFWSALNFKGEAASPPRKEGTPRHTQGTPASSPSSTATTTITTTTSGSGSPQAVDELAASLSQVTLDDPAASRGQEEETEGQLQGACGGAFHDGVNTFLVSQYPTAEELYAVVPATWCPHLEEVQPVPNGTLNTSIPCQECHDPNENWVCLTCFRVLCGRFVSEHMLLHGVCEEHHLVLSFSDLSVWCYACDVYIHHPKLFEAKRAAHLDKFGEDMPECC